MCGIAGTVGIPREKALPIAQRMLKALRHRGPDDEGLSILTGPAGECVVLAHTRLAILDLSPAGHQPMGTLEGDGTRAITFNGEIYNFAQLREELRKDGAQFHTATDTEVILEASRLWGEDAVERMRGMFAWCLADRTKGTVWLCRDRLGKKPLYLVRPEGGGLLFASEVRALLEAGPELVPPSISRTALESFLAQGMVCGLDSIIEGIRLLAPGTSLVCGWDGNPKSERIYWSLPFGGAPPHVSNRHEAIEELRRRLREAVRFRLIADVPLGVFLSGGVDSAAITALATELRPGQIKTVSVGFDQPEFDESPLAEKVAKSLGTEHVAVRLSGPELLDELGAVFNAMDQPTVDGFNTYVVARAARQAGLTVALSGVGGDEVFGGYASFRDVPLSVRFSENLAWIKPFVSSLARATRAWGGRRWLKMTEVLGRPGSMTQLYLLRRELFLPEERRLLHDLPAGMDRWSGLPHTNLSALEHSCAQLQPENAVSYLELNSYLRDMLLRDADVFSMAVPLELRSPLLDHEVVTYVFGLPGAWKRPDPRAKPLLVDAVGPRLPAETYLAPKRGFTFPWEAWLRGPMHSAAQAILQRHEAWRALGIAPDVPADLWKRFLRKDPGVSGTQVIALWALGEFAIRHNLRART